MFKKVTFLIILLGQMGCSTLDVHLYDSPEKPVSELATFRVHGPSIIVETLDGQSVENFGNAGRVSKAYTLPGAHTFGVYTFRDAYWNPQATGYSYAKDQIEVDVKAGHTYIFTVQHNKEGAVFSYEDKGENYNPLCLEPQAWGNVPFRKKIEVEGC